MLSMDVIRNVNATELRNLLNETYEKAVEENRAMETERLQSINQRMHEIGWEFVPSHLEEYGTYVYTANGKATLILESADAVEEWMTQRNLAWELDDYMHDLNPYDYKNRTGISYNGTAEERELQKEKLLEKIRKGDVADIVEQLSVYSTYSEENNKAITPYLNRLSTYLPMQEAQENDYQGIPCFQNRIDAENQSIENRGYLLCEIGWNFFLRRIYWNRGRNTLIFIP